jgi:hypothetical protein
MKSTKMKTKPLLLLLLIMYSFGLEASVIKSWQPLSTGLTPLCAEGYSFCVYNDELYVGGSFDSAGGISVHNIARWNGTNWDSVGNGIHFSGTSCESGVYSMIVFNGELYVGGDIDSAGGFAVNGVARWNGVTWDSLGSGVYNVNGDMLNNGTVKSFYIFDSLLYVGGSFNYAGNISLAHAGDGGTLSEWDGNAWHKYDSLSANMDFIFGNTFS